MKALSKYLTLYPALLAALALILMGCSQPASPTNQPQTTEINAETVATIVQQTLIAQASQPVALTPAPLATDTPAVVAPTATAGLPVLPTATPIVEPSPTAEPTQTPQPTATTIPLPTSTPPTGDPRESLGGPSFTDTMDNSTYWPTGADDFTDVSFDGGEMVYTALTGTDGWRLLTYHEVEDFYVEIRGEFEDCSGTDHFGLIVRVPEKDEADRGYLFGISCDGRFTFNEWDATAGTSGSWTSHIFWKADPAIQAGEGKTNRIGIMADGDRISLYVNGVKVAEVKDSTFTEGALGVYVGSDETEELTVRIEELNLWVLDD